MPARPGAGAIMALCRHRQPRCLQFACHCDHVRRRRGAARCQGWAPECAPRPPGEWPPLERLTTGYGRQTLCLNHTPHTGGGNGADGHTRRIRAGRRLGQAAAGQHATTSVMVTWAVLSLLVAQQVTPAALARALPAAQAGSGRSCLRRVRRWWRGPPLDQTVVRPQVIAQALALLPPGQAVLVALATTRLGPWAVWLAGSVVQGRTLPIGGAVGRFRATTLALRQRRQAAFPPAVRWRLVADRGFPSAALFAHLRQGGTDWHVRLRLSAWGRWRGSRHRCASSWRPGGSWSGSGCRPPSGGGGGRSRWCRRRSWSATRWPPRRHTSSSRARPRSARCGRRRPPSIARTSGGARRRRRAPPPDATRRPGCDSPRRRRCRRRCARTPGA